MPAKKDNLAYTIQDQINSHLKQIEKIKEEKNKMIEKYDSFINTQKEIVEFLKSKSPKSSLSKAKKSGLQKEKKRVYTTTEAIEEGIMSALKKHPEGIMISKIKAEFEASGGKVSLGAIDRNIKKMIANKVIKKLNPDANFGIKYVMESRPEAEQNS